MALTVVLYGLKVLLFQALVLVQSWVWTWFGAGSLLSQFYNNNALVLSLFQ